MATVGDTTPLDKYPAEKVHNLPTRLEYRREAPVNDIGYCSNPSKVDAKQNPRRARRRDDSTVAACCAWVVEHQIGKLVRDKRFALLTNNCYLRPCNQPPPSPWSDALMLSSRKAAHPQILRIVLLQRKFRWLRYRLGRCLHGPLLDCGIHWSAGCGNGLHSYAYRSVGRRGEEKK